MRNTVLVIVILGIAAVAFYLGRKSGEPVQPPDTSGPGTPVVTAAGPAQEADRIQYPVKNPASADADAVKASAALPLPDLDQSDGPVQEAISNLYDSLQLDKLFNFKSVIRHIVVTVDNMTAAKLPQKFKFTRLPAGSFLVASDTDGGLSIAPANYKRYTPYVRFIEAVDMHRLTALYFRYYPLFQQAYEDLGYPDRYFNDRLVEVIDHLLAAPDVQDPIRLKQPVVYYTFANPELEQLSAGQKLMIRIGPENSSRVKSWLRKLRAELISASVKSEKTTSH